MNHRWLASVASLAMVTAPVTAATPAPSIHAQLQPQLGSRTVKIIALGGIRFRDMDRDGKLSPFEDWRLPPQRRATDLAARLSVEEMAGLTMHSHLPGIGNALGFSAKGYDLEAVRTQVNGEHVTSFITRLAVRPKIMAEQNNEAQAIAEASRFGIPLTISTDPRNHFQYVLGASTDALGYSQWPEALGFAALRDAAIAKRFADIVRREYRATGIQEALSPQADLLTEPRWPRGLGTFGSRASVVGPLVKAYVEGFQGGSAGITRNGVMAVVKHWVGYGAGIEGFDGHNYYGRIAQVDRRSLAVHIAPFLPAFAVKVAGVMPTYDILQGGVVNGRQIEPVGAGFSRELLTDLLRKKYRYDGIVLSDWNITLDCTTACSNPTTPQPPEAIAMPWGVEKLTPLQRYAKGFAAGVDQFGGVHETSVVADGATAGVIPIPLLRAIAVRVLTSKFQLGLFENPYVDPVRAADTVGTRVVQDEADSVQSASQVLLKNDTGNVPLKPGAKLFLRGIDPDTVKRAGFIVVSKPEEADAALVRVSTPHDLLHPNAFFGSRQNEGRLDFRPGIPDFDAVASLSRKTKVIVSVFADRPPILTRLLPLSSVLVINFGVSDDALIASLSGKAAIRGRLPYDLPSSMAAVMAQRPDLPDDDAAPLFRFGAGIDLPRAPH